MDNALSVDGDCRGTGVELWYSPPLGQNSRLPLWIPTLGQRTLVLGFLRIEKSDRGNGGYCCTAVFDCQNHTTVQSR